MRQNTGARAAVCGQKRLSSSGQEAGMAASSRDNALDHVIVVVFGNRSLDNLLGRLYGPGDGKTFEGVIGKDLSNPIPEWAEHGADRKVVYHPQLRRDPVPPAAPRRPGNPAPRPDPGVRQP
jgi:hypothetical protein